MDYELPERISRWQYLSLFLLVLFIFLYIRFLNDTSVNINFEFINTFGIFLGIITYFSLVYKEYRFNKRLNELLFKEMYSNILTINDNLYLIGKFKKNPFKQIYGFGYITNNIYHSLVGTNKIAILKAEIIAPLVSFYNSDQTIRRIMNDSETFRLMMTQTDEKGFLIENKLIEMKSDLKQIFNELGKSELFEKLKTKGNKHQLIQQKPNEESLKIPNPQTF